METKAYTFMNIFNSQYNIKKIVIPMIQRDYAQGRENRSANRVRKNFLDALYSALISKPIILDFIYGDVNNGVMTPLDGQQRLTTLFLLHWYAAKKDIIEKSEYEFLRNFTYETRYSTRDFCSHLIDFEPELFSQNTTHWQNNILSKNNISGYQTLSQEIEDQKWFALSWKNDPTISSMLVMLDAIDLKFRDIPNIWEKLKNGAISFYFLGIDEMGLSDELYIRMNSRGKPLTPFEHFKAEFEKLLKRFDEKEKLYGNSENSGKEYTQGYAQEIIRKIDREWTDMIWKYHTNENIDYVVDRGFLCYFRFLCDLISYMDNEIPQNRGVDEFDILNYYFSIDKNQEVVVDNPNISYESLDINLKNRMEYIERNIKFLNSAFDIWDIFKTRDQSFSFFSSYICNNIPTNETDCDKITHQCENTKDTAEYKESGKECCNRYDPQKIKISKSDNIDIFEDCLLNYADVFGNRKRKFELRKIVFLFSFLVYLLNRDKISDGDFKERLRIINNLINNSGPEINERENRMTKILKQTQSIILYGFEKEIESVGFNSIQMKEEKEKYIWRREHPNLIDDLNRIEDHYLLHGQIGIIGLDCPLYFTRFESLFNCNLDLVDCALMSMCFYPKEENHWRSQFGSGEITSSWENLFHGNIADNTKEAVRALLSMKKFKNEYKDLLETYEIGNCQTSSSDFKNPQNKYSRQNNNFKFTDEILKEIADSFIKECENSKFYDFRYYYIKYPGFRPGRYGRYYRFYYGYSVIWAQHRISENSYNPFLKEIFESEDFKEYTKENNLKVELFKDFMLIDRVKMEISEDGFIFKDFESDKELEKMIVEKSSVMREDFPLQNIKRADMEDRIELFSLKKDKIFKKLNIFKI